jgi:2-polyprenyl-3-methyl-5-hydroxy-6-metoxy-1,4-benzoquinol methylase
MALEETLRAHGIGRNAWGFYQVLDKPDARALSEYYEKKYYQQGQGHYGAAYSPEERRYYLDKVELKALALEALTARPSTAEAPLSLLDVGCGEGFTLEHFRQKSWSLLGLDYSDHGCAAHNPACLPFVQKGDLYSNLAALIAGERRFDVIWLDNVLEHVLDPLALLRSLRGLTKPGGVLVIEVPNDFSELQLQALDSGRVSRPFWVALPDHLSYFNKAGLVALCADAGWSQRRVLADYWIDFNLFNERTNYVEDRSAGKLCHQARIAAETLMMGISPEKTNALYEALADLGLGRQIVGFFS